MPLFVLTGVGSPGRSTISALAAESVKKSPFYLFSPLHTTVNRPAVEGKEVDEPPSFQDEHHVSEEEYKTITDAGGYLHAWKDRTFMYGILKEVEEALTEEKKVVLSVPSTSLSDVQDIAARFPTTFINVTAPSEVLATRKTQNKAELKLVVKKIAKLQNDFRLRGGEMTILENIGTPEDGRNAFLTIMGFDAATEIPPPDANDLQNCLPQDYLKRTVFPHLASGMSLLETVRPADPVDFLALYLYRSATTQKRKVAEMREQQRLRTELRAEIHDEHTVEGRI